MLKIKTNCVPLGKRIPTWLYGFRFSIIAYMPADRCVSTLTTANTVFFVTQRVAHVKHKCVIASYVRCNKFHGVRTMDVRTFWRDFHTVFTANERMNCFANETWARKHRQLGSSQKWGRGKKIKFKSIELDMIIYYINDSTVKWTMLIFKSVLV